MTAAHVVPFRVHRKEQSVSIVLAGTGYVGLVTGACLCEVGHSVFCVDIDPERVRRLSAGEVPFYEPGLAALVKEGVDRGRLSFTTSLRDAYQRSKQDRTLSAPVVMIAVGTPSADDGSADIGVVLRLRRKLAEVIDKYTVVASKSTVPVGTSDKVAQAIKAAGADSALFDVASNPEFLKEGAAVEDFMRPTASSSAPMRPRAEKVMLELYRPFSWTKTAPDDGHREAEMTKYAANALLATKISFINEMANLCDRMGVDINDVRRGIGHDPPHRLRVPLPRRRLRRKLFPEGRAGADPHGAHGRCRATRARCDAPAQRTPEAIHRRPGEEAVRTGPVAAHLRSLGPGVQAGHR